MRKPIRSDTASIENVERTKQKSPRNRELFRCAAERLLVA
jgi:hypothetical protein